MTVFPDPRAPLEAIRETWAANKDIVARFVLTFDERHMGVIGRSYYASIFVGKSDANPYELSRAIETLQQDVENRSGLDVTLTVEPFSEENESPAA